MKKIILSALAVLFFQPAFAQDEADHPLIKRYPGSAVVIKETSDYADVSFMKTCDRQIPVKIPLQGKQTKIFYGGPREKTVAEIYANYSAAVKKAGFEILYETPPGKKLSFTCKTAVLRQIEHFMKVGNVSGDQIKAIVAKKRGTHVQILSGDSKKQGPVIFVNIVEQKEIQTDQVVLNADHLAQELDQSGHVAIYGILFDTDSAVIQASSKPTLEQIAKLLQSRAMLRLYVVGHSDMQGELKYNLDLSKRRAEAVVQSLTTDYKIGRSRLEAHGVGPLTPKASNRSEDGRKENRRVELIEIN